MEKELNIAAILKEKPKGIELYEITTDMNVLFDHVTDNDNIKCTSDCYFPSTYSKTGTFSGYQNGIQILKPSKEMQDWNKFAWKKGDFLKRNTKKGNTCIFVRFTSDDYTTFEGIYGESLVGSYCNTNEWQIVKNEQKIKDIVYRIEKQYHGKLNLETLEIEREPKQEFKDGDIVTEYSSSPFVTIFIFKKFGEYGGKTLSYYSYLQEGSFRTTTGWIDIRKNFKFRLATDSEKQRLFDALANKNKAWDADKKQFVDLPKKCEFKAFDKVLVRDKDEGCVWNAAFFSHKDEKYFVSTGFHGWQQCIPYNDQTAHLLGTTDDWKGGE